LFEQPNRTLRHHAADTPFNPIAAAGEKIDPQQPQATAILHAGIGRSPGSRGMRMLNRWGLAARMKPGRPPRSVAQASPAGSTAPGTTNEKQRKELTMLIDQMIADCSLSDLCHRSAHGAALHRYFAPHASRERISVRCLHSECLSNGALRIDAPIFTTSGACRQAGGQAHPPVHGTFVPRYLAS